MKVLKASPSTVHWGYLDSSIPPVLTIEDGETVFGNPAKKIGTIDEKGNRKLEYI